MRLFPARQIYLRSNGNVRFVQFSTRAQLIIASMAIAVVGWFAFASGHFMTRDLVLEAREDTIRKMAADYDQLSDDMGSIQREVIDRANRLEMRQRYLNGLMAEEPLGKFSGEFAEDAATEYEGASLATGAKSLAIPLARPTSDDAEIAGTVGAGSVLAPDQAGGIEEEASAVPLSSPNLIPSERPLFASFISSAHAALPDNFRPTEVFRAEMLTRLGRVETEQTALAGQLINHARKRLSALDLAIETTGIESDDLIAYWKGSFGTAAAGGPFIPDPNSLEALGLSRTSSGGSASDMLVQLDAEWDRLLKAYDAVHSLPSMTPADDYYVSSRFGKRTDPIKKTRAMHYAVDLAGWPGNKILSGADGVVSKAGTWGSYGNMIEIDHGNGFKTRYGHLRRISVKRGDVLEAGQPIGEMGCSGRCTSTHLHYEVWFAGKPRNPLPFIKVASNVHEIQQRRPLSGDTE